MSVMRYAKNRLSVWAGYLAELRTGADETSRPLLTVSAGTPEESRRRCGCCGQLLQTVPEGDL